MKNLKPYTYFLLLTIASVSLINLIFLKTDSVRAGDSFFEEKIGVKNQNSLTKGFRTEEEQRTIDVYKNVNQSVVFITTISLEIDPFDYFLEAKPREGTGSGVIVDSNKGIVLTNLHVIGNASRIEITLGDGKSYRAKLLGFDKDNDLAVLSIIEKPQNLTQVEFADSSVLEVGQRVLAIGNPFGLNKTLTSGIISSLNRVVKSPQGVIMKGLIQTDAAINPGNSGGPLLDLDGRLIGINTAILSQSGDSAGIGFSVPVNQIKRLLPDLIERGKILRPKMGWIISDTNHGPMVERVLDGGPAFNAEILSAYRKISQGFLLSIVRDPSQADFIMSVNGKKVKNVEEVDEAISKIKQGQSVLLVVRNGGLNGEEREVEVVPNFQ